MPYMVVGSQTISSGVLSAGVLGPNTAMLLGAKTLTSSKVLLCLISRATSKIFKVPWTFTLCAGRYSVPAFSGEHSGRLLEKSKKIVSVNK